MKVEQTVTRKKKKGTTALKVVMATMSVLFLVLAVAFQTGYMFFCFIFAAMFFVYEANSEREYEYEYEDNTFNIYLIKARRNRRLIHSLDLDGLEVVAPHDHEAVRMYKKGAGVKLPKYDYTSYEDDVMYYTMIVTDDNKKIKLLLDLNDEMLMAIKYKNHDKVKVSFGSISQ